MVVVVGGGGVRSGCGGLCIPHIALCWAILLLISIVICFFFLSFCLLQSPSGVTGVRVFSVCNSRRWQDDIAKKEGTTWNRKVDRRQWKALMEGSILQWMDKA